LDYFIGIGIFKATVVSMIQKSHRNTVFVFG